MQHRSPRAVAVGVDPGTAHVMVSIRGRGERSDTRALDGIRAEADTSTLSAAFEHVHALLGETAADRPPLAVTVPASWERDRFDEVAEAAEAAGLDRPSFVPAAVAATRYVEARGHSLEPGTALVVYGLGARSCEVGVVRRDEDGHTVMASQSLNGIGGDEFDDLILAYLSGRHRDTDPGFWDRVADPSEEALRSALLNAIRHARERLSEHASTGIVLSETGPELRITQHELESCIGELVEQGCDAATAALAASGVDSSEVAGLLLTGGASRTPLVVARLAERTGLEPVLPDRPEQIPAEGASFAALAAIPVSAERSRLHRAARRAGVLASLLVLLAGAIALFGSELGTGESPRTMGDDAPSALVSSEAASPSEGAVGSGGAEAPNPGEVQRSGTAEAEDPEEAETTPEPDEAPSPPGDDREERAEAGAVPDVTAMSAQEARWTLDEAGFTNVDFESERDPLFGPWYDDCEVKAQDPPPQTRIAFDEPVTVTYSYAGSDSSFCEE